MNLNLRKIQHVAGLALQNGIRLHIDSLKLYKLKSYPTAVFISVVSMEEIGKAYWADHFVWTSIINGRANIEFEAEWLHMLLGDHKKKQMNFLRHIFSTIDKKFYAFVDSRQLEILKQNSIYVGLQKPIKGMRRTDGKIINPMKINSEKARQQIQFIHNFLVTEIENMEKGIIYHDLFIFRKTLTLKLLKELESHKI